MSDPSPASAVSSKASEAAGSNTQDLAARPDLADSAEVDKPFSAADAPTSQQVAEGAWWRSRFWAWTLLLLAMAGLAGALLAWQKIDHIQEELARRSLDTSAQVVEARTLARQAQEATRELSLRLASAETRLSEVSLQRSQLEELMRSLSRSRDDNLVVEMEAGLRLAQQQAQLTGSAEPLLAALKSAEQRLARAGQPRLSPVQRAIVKDSERVKSAALTDVPALRLRIDELVRLADDLPVANAVLVADQPAAIGTAEAGVLTPKSPATGKSAAPAQSSWWRFLDVQVLREWSVRTLAGLREEARGLLRVSRIDLPEAALLAPEQAYFLRENLKLKLLNARLALLSRQTEVARSDLTSAQISLQRYFDASSRKTQAALAALQQAQVQLRAGELPRLDETLAALATAAAGR
jgi:uroporphyrin-3 C-methyltransferase